MEVHLITGLPRNNHLLGKLIGQEAQTLCTQRESWSGLFIGKACPYVRLFLVITGYRLTTGYWVPGPVKIGLSHAEDLS